MEAYDVYRDICERTGGDIYIGVVGPVRTGKSTFISRMMEHLVLPAVADAHEKQRITDELPQSGAGRAIMTTQPRFIPGEPVEVKVGPAALRVRLVDCVGYMAEGATGHMEGEEPRMVHTPWSEEDIPFCRAAELGTRKVIRDHSTIGLVMTTDGTIADLPRDSYLPGEEEAIRELKSLGKPFMILLNSARAASPEAAALALELEEKYAAPVMLLDVLHMGKGDVDMILSDLLYQFPIRQVRLETPAWLSALGRDHWLLEDLVSRAQKAAREMDLMRDYVKLEAAFSDSPFVSAAPIRELALGEGSILGNVELAPGLFYQVLAEACGCEIRDESHLLSLMGELVEAKKQYDQLAAALRETEKTGYGVVPPILDQLALEKPQLLEQGKQFGLRLRASAPSLHIVRVDVQAEVSPVLGSEQQSEEMLRRLQKDLKEDPQALWQTEFFGRSLSDLMAESLTGKLQNMPPEAKAKLRTTLGRMVNEGDGGMLCILL